MAFRSGKNSPEATAGAMLVAESLLYIQVLAKIWGAK